MREILFRGKPKREDEYYFFSQAWNDNCKDGFVFGSLVISKDGRYYISVTALCCINSCINNGTTTMIEVIPRTVGQYTGLTDKNGTKIFEGDIIKALSDSGNTSCITSVGIGNCKETSDDGTTAIAVYTTYFSDGYYVLPTNKKYKNRTEVIGNIHDNPELLKEMG